MGRINLLHSARLTRRALLGASCAALAAPLRAAELQKVSFASVNALSDAGVFLADELGYFAEQGIVCDYNVIGSAPTLITAAITGQVDVAGVAVTPGLFAATQRGIDIRLVGDKQSVRPGFSNTRMVVGAKAFTGDKASSIAALRGQSVGVSARGSTAFFLMAKTLAKNGVKVDDVRVVEMEYANIAAGLTNGAIAGGMLLDPFLSRSIHDGSVVEVSDCSDVAPGGNASIVSIVYSEAMERNRDLAQRWMIAYVRGVRAYNDAYRKNIGKDRVIALLAKHTHIDPAVVAQSFPVGLDPDQYVNLEALAEFQDFFAEQGMLRQKSDVTRIVDLSFAQNAVATLGHYS